jgi:HEAT repeat protein
VQRFKSTARADSVASRDFVRTLRFADWIVAAVCAVLLAGCATGGGLFGRKDRSSIKIESVPDALATIRESRDPVARWLAIEYLGEPRRVGSDQANRDEISEILALAIANEPEPNARIHILQSLDQLGSRKRVPAYLEATKDKDASVRVTACRLLGKAGAPIPRADSGTYAEGSDYSAKATEVLDSLLTNDPSLDVRLAAAEALSHLPSEQSALALVGGLSDSDVAIRFRCRESLRAITGKDHAGDLNKWREEIQTANFEELANRRHARFLW